MKELFFLCDISHLVICDVLSICFYHSSSGQILTIKLAEVRLQLHLPQSLILFYLSLQSTDTF